MKTALKSFLRGQIMNLFLMSVFTQIKTIKMPFNCVKMPFNCIKKKPKYVKKSTLNEKTPYVKLASSN